MRSFLRDVRYAARSFGKAPGVAVVAALALILGIGLTTTVSSIVYAALMRGLPYPGAERLAVVQRANPSRDIPQMPVPIHDFVDYRERQRSFESLAAAYSGTVNVSGTERAERLTGAWVTANLFAVYGVEPVLGRGIRAGEDRPGGDQVAVIAYRVWQDRFGGSPAVLGQRIRANGRPFTIVGVMPEGFGLPSNAQLWMPLQLDPLALKRGEGQWLDVYGRLRPGVSLNAATADLRAIAKRIEAEHKEQNEGVTARAVTFMEGELGPEPRQLLLTMLGAVVLVLLIACTNVANLLLDRAAHRTREVGIRMALGARGRDMVGLVFGQGLVQLGAGMAAGLALALGVSQLLTVILFGVQPRDPAVFAGVVAVLTGAGLLACVVPARRAARADPLVALRAE